MNSLEYYLSILYLVIEFLCVGSLNTVFNIEELNSINYDVDIVNRPVVKNAGIDAYDHFSFRIPVKHERKLDGELITLFNKRGQEYVCILPAIPEIGIDNKKDESILDQLTDISVLLKPMEAAPCITKTKDWWTYEFCYGSVIKQYHLEDNKVTGQILILGKYESEYNWKNSSETKNRLQRFHSQYYVNGTKCDVTAEPRRAEVRFHCEEGVGDYIQRVDEPESCRYIVTIATTKVCHHPYLKPRPDQMSHNIVCSPALTPEQYDLYARMEEAESAKRKMPKETIDTPLSILPKLSKYDPDSPESSNKVEGDEEPMLSIRFYSFPHSKKGKFLGASDTKDGLIKALDSDISKTPVDEGLSETASQEDQSGNTVKILENAEHDDKLIEKEENYTEDAKLLKLLLQQITSEKLSELTLLAEKYSHKKFSYYFKELFSMLSKAKHQFEQNDYLNEFVNNEAEELIIKIMAIPLLHLSMAEEDKEEFSYLYAGIYDYLEIDSLNKLTNRKRVFYLKDIKKKYGMLSENKEIGDSDAEKHEDLESTEAQQSDDQNDKVFEQNSFAKDILGNTENKDVEVGLDDNDFVDNKITSSSSEVTILEENASQEGVEGVTEDKITQANRMDKLEKSIKDKLQKSGLQNLGRKIEVKILTPNYLEDEDYDSLSSLTEEETDAFQNMIINILSANAEELEEKEKHKNLENNYNYAWEDEDRREDVSINEEE